MTVLRADASAALGMGHVMRLAAIAERLPQRGRCALFVTREDPVARELLEGSGCACHFLPEQVGLDEDARLTGDAAMRAGADVIVTDVCHATAEKRPAALAAYHRALKASRALVVSFGGAHYLDPAADIAIYPYVSGLAPPAIVEGQEALVGPAYFVFRSEFTAGDSTLRAVAMRADAVLVTIGGSDPSALTALAIEALARADAPELRIVVVVGAGFPDDYRRRLESAGGVFGDRIEWVIAPRSMAGHMRRADLAVTGDGLTKYETALAGTPTITLSRTDSDAPMNDEFARAGTSVHLAPGCGIDALAGTISALRLDTTQRAEMTRRGTRMFDGRGVERIIDAIEARLVRGKAGRRAPINAGSGHPTC